MENAAKFKHPDRPQIVHISGWTSNKFCHYKIRDNGIGFEPIYREKIFGVFERLHPKQEYEGTGIGLSNVMRIIERHGGSINADGQEDEFAEFVFSIPKGDQNDSNS